MANLYEINREILSCIDDDTGEIIDFEKLSELAMEKECKVENLALLIKNLRSEAESCKAEAEAFRTRAKVAESKSKRLCEYLGEILDHKPFKAQRAEISFRRSVAVAVDDDARLPEEFLIVKREENPNKKAIGDALKSGREIEGCRLVENRTIQIK